MKINLFLTFFFFFFFFLNTEELEYIRSEEAVKFLNELPQYPRKPWASQFPDASPKALDLLDKMLQFHFAKRISVDDAIAHPYFDSVRAYVMRYNIFIYL